MRTAKNQEMFFFFLNLEKQQGTLNTIKNLSLMTRKLQTRYVLRMV